MNNPNAAPAYNPAPAQPFKPVKTNRGLLKLILLSIITLGIYGIYFLYSVKRDLNRIAADHNGKKTMGLIPLFLLSIITFGIASIVWMHKISNRIGNEQAIRGLPKTISAASFWGWNVLGSLIIVGPFIFVHKICSSMNAISADFNRKGC